MQHPFILESGNWYGEGSIQFSMMEEGKLPLTTHWVIPSPDKEGKIAAIQEIQVEGMNENMRNHFLFYNIEQEEFHVALENQSFGSMVGKGIVNPKVIGWEFRLEQFGFEGFEFYEATKKKDMYLCHAEYATADDFRTIIHGKIWKVRKKTKSSKSKGMNC